jgi:hypothetical protein
MIAPVGSTTTPLSCPRTLDWSWASSVLEQKLDKSKRKTTHIPDRFIVFLPLFAKASWLGEWWMDRNRNACVNKAKLLNEADSAFQ